MIPSFALWRLEPARAVALLETSLLFALPLAAAAGPLLQIAGPLFVYRLMLIVLACLLLFRRGWRIDGWPKRIMVLGALWLAWGAVAAFPTSDLRAAMQSLLGVGSGIFAMLALSLATSRSAKAYRTLSDGWIFALAISLIIGTWEAITHHHLSNYYDGVHLEWYSPSVPTAFFGNPNNFGFFLLISLMFVYERILRTRSARVRALWGLMVVASFAMMVLGSARIDLAAAAVQALAVFGLTTRSSRQRIVMVSALAAAAVLVVAAALSSAKVSSWLASGAQSTLEVRGQLIGDGLWMFAHSFGAGVGPGQFETSLLHYSHRLPYQTESVLSPHNFFLEVGVEYGLLILALAVWFLGKLGRTVFTMPPARRNAILATFAGLLIACTAMSTYLISSSTWLWFAVIIAALPLDYERPAHLSGVDGSPRNGEHRPRV